MSGSFRSGLPAAEARVLHGRRVGVSNAAFRPRWEHPKRQQESYQGFGRGERPEWIFAVSKPDTFKLHQLAIVKKSLSASMIFVSPPVAESCVQPVTLHSVSDFLSVNFTTLHFSAQAHSEMGLCLPTVLWEACRRPPAEQPTPFYRKIFLIDSICRRSSRRSDRGSIVIYFENLVKLSSRGRRLSPVSSPASRSLILHHFVFTP